MINFLDFLRKKSNIIYWIALGIGLILLIVIQYFGLVYYHYPVPPGHDAMIHWWTAQPFYRGEIDLIPYLRHGGYPPLFLLFIAKFAHLFHTDMMNVMLWFSPSILVLSALSIFALSYYLFNRYVALITFFLYAFTTRIVVQQLNDGGYPNLIAAQIFIPIFIICTVCGILSRSWWQKLLCLVGAFIFIILVFLTHHLSTLYLFAIVVICTPIIFVWLSKKNCWKTKKIIISSVILLLVYILGFFVFFRAEFTAASRNLLESALNFSNSFPFIRKVGTQDMEALISLRSYPHYVGESVFIFGVIGTLMMPLSGLFKKDKKAFLGVIIFSVWSLLLLIGSRMDFLSNPDRLVRDSAYPLSLMAGIFIYYFSGRILELKKQRSIAFACWIFILATISFLPFASRIKKAFAYEPMVRVTNADMQAINYLQSQKPGILFMESYTFYFDVFLPNWQISHLWLSETAQPSWVHPLDPSIPEELSLIKHHDYVYIVDSQAGWTPSAIKFHFASKYLASPEFTLVVHAESKTNDVYLFKVKK